MQLNRELHRPPGRVVSLAPLAALIVAGCGGGAAAKASPQTTEFAEPAPALLLLGTATVSATASSGLAVTYSSLTPTVCSVAAATGVVTDIAAGTCTVAADQAGDADYLPASQATQSLVVSEPITAFDAPTAVAASLGDSTNTVVVTFSAPASSDGSPITGYTVTSTPSGITGAGSTSPITVTCPSSCAGYAFAVSASNGVGAGAASAPVDVITSFDVVETFNEPETQPDNTIFIGSFTLDSTSKTVSNLAGSLTESMTGPPMATVSLTYQLSDVSDGLGGQGQLVTVFALNTTNTFDPSGFAPGGWQYCGYAAGATNPKKGGIGNAYAMIDVNTDDPTAPATQAQINLLAYADCTAGGMMGPACMTGTTEAGYGTTGTMGGYPISQVVIKR